MMAGAEKHGGEYNWRDRSESATNLIDGCIRHLLALRDGEEVAQDDGRPHAGHVIARMAIYLDAQSLGKLIDDRPRPNVCVGRAINGFEEWAKKRPARKEETSEPGVPTGGCRLSDDEIVCVDKDGYAYTRDE